MGAGVSAGESNDELIDNLVEADYIKTSLIERVFRAVDRGNYILTDPQVNPYRDVAWKSYNFHISAPCIYSEVMEGLQLQSGLSFLNLGSGTGYLNTMVGLILGHNGINHGIELHQEVVDYANKKLDEFKLHSGAIDEYDFCEPKFIQGNCLCITNDHYLYDRVYCGAACPDEYVDFIRSLVKIGGILIVPFNERLVEMKRTTETNWNIRSLLPVSFANLVIPPRNTTEDVHLLDIEPLSLQELCRACIRNLIRKTIEKEYPTITKTDSSVTRKASKKKRSNRSRDNNCNRTHNNGNTVLSHTTTMCDRDGIIDDFLFLISRRSLTRSSLNNDNDNETSGSESNIEMEDDKQQIVTEYDMSEEDNNSNDDDDDDDGSGGGCDEQLKHMHGVFVDIINTFGNTPQTNDDTTPSTSTHTDNDNKMDDSSYKENNDCGIKRKTSSDDDNDSDNNGDDDDDDDGKNSTNGAILRNPQIEIETDSSDDDFESETTTANNNNNNDRCRTTKWRRLNSNYNDNEMMNDDDDDDKSTTNNILKVYKSSYTDYIKEKIKELPLPFILKKYLNFYKDF